ncbi:MAG: hypothetical protein ACE5KH_05825 [Candidatus Geothermarchaeales archaeon]
MIRRGFEPHKVTLLRAVEEAPENIVYRREWEELQHRNPNLKVVHIMTRPEDSTEEWKGKVGRIGEALIRENVEDTSEAIFYGCGTPSMVRGLTTLLISMGIEPYRILVDSFFGYD